MKEYQKLSIDDLFNQLLDELTHIPQLKFNPAQATAFLQITGILARHELMFECFTKQLNDSELVQFKKHNDHLKNYFEHLNEIINLLEALSNAYVNTLNTINTLNKDGIRLSLDGDLYPNIAFHQILASNTRQLSQKNVKQISNTISFITMHFTSVNVSFLESISSGFQASPKIKNEFYSQYADFLLDYVKLYHYTELLKNNINTIIDGLNETETTQENQLILVRLIPIFDSIKTSIQSFFTESNQSSYLEIHDTLNNLSQHLIESIKKYYDCQAAEPAPSRGRPHSLFHRTKTPDKPLLDMANALMQTLNNIPEFKEELALTPKLK